MNFISVLILYQPNYPGNWLNIVFVMQSATPLFSTLSSSLKNIYLIEVALPCQIYDLEQ